MAESLSKSSLELNGSINTEVIENINNLNNSIIDIQKTSKRQIRWFWIERNS